MSKKLFTLLFFMVFSLWGKAAVIVTDIVPDSSRVLSDAATWFSIDLNHDGTDDFTFRYSVSTAVGRHSGAQIFFSGPAGNSFFSTSSTAIGIPNVAALDSGAVIDASLTFAGASTSPEPYIHDSSFGSSYTGPVGTTAFANKGTKYIGVGFDIAGATHYGWIAINFNSSSRTLTVMGYGYESSASTGIVAGAPTSTVITPVANYKSSVTATDTKTAVTFTDLSTNAPTAWEWTFNPATVSFTGGTGASSQNPQVLFGAAGKYTVKLKATNSAGSDSITKTDYIIVYTTPAADFTASTLSTDTKTTVTFTETCTGDPTNMEWTFTPATVTYMAGTGSKSKNPQVTFNAVGKYTVSLKASNAAGTDTEVKTDYVTVSDAPTGIGSYSAEGKGLRVYPNPASKTLVIEQPDAEATIDIFDLGGKAELSRPLKGKKTELDISRLPKGCHILQLTSPNGVTNQKLLIE